MTDTDPDNPGLGRRAPFTAGTAGLALSAAAGGGSASAQSSPPAIDTGVVRDGRVSFPDWRGEAEPPSPPPPAPLPPERRVGFALVGLGRLALEELLPAFAECRYARPVALVSGTPEKARLVAAQYGIKPEAIHGYADIPRLRENPEVRAVYVVTPNSLHREQVEAAAAAGKHVLCEKPMATSSADARAMIAACDAARVKLMVAYRVQYEPHNREVIRMLRSGELGAARLIETNNCQVQGDPAQWRLRKALAGGGSLPDIGIYCLNTARALTGEEPVEVFARIHTPPNDPRFAEVEDTVSFMLRFPSGTVANCATSYSAFNSKDLRVRSERGWAGLENAYATVASACGWRSGKAKRRWWSSPASASGTSSRWRWTTSRAACWRTAAPARRARRACATTWRWRRSTAPPRRASRWRWSAWKGWTPRAGRRRRRRGEPSRPRRLLSFVWLSGAPRCYSGRHDIGPPLPGLAGRRRRR